MGIMVDLTEITLIPEPSRDILNQREAVDYESHRRKYLSWLLTFGKNPDHADGYAQATISKRAYRIDKFYRWVWGQEDRYTTDVLASARILLNNITIFKNIFG
jgi:hypothetical protein